MYQLAKSSDKERSIVFRNTASKMGLNEAIVEKDFWVVLMLDYLFNRCQYKNAFTFKGGTSLSKCYNIIKRFSEDIDIILDWRILGIDPYEPYANRSNNKQEQYNKHINHLANMFIANTLVPMIKHDLKQEFGFDPEITTDVKEDYVIIFNYPKLFKDPSIINSIRLEFGALAALTPSEMTLISSYVHEQYPSILMNPFARVLTVKPERTFWEKVTILHQEVNRPITSKLPERYSRHYYDIFMFSQLNMTREIIKETALLDKVVQFKKKFYPRSWARFDLAQIGSLKLVPHPSRIKELENDYHQMQEMLFGKKPSFEEIISYLIDLEKEINETKILISV